MIEKLTEENFILFAAKHYDNPQCYDTEEFLDDIKRFKYLKRLFGKYLDSGDLKERLILNHIVILYNMFGEHTTRMLFFKLKEEFHPCLKPFLVLLNQMPEKVVLSHDHVIHSSSIPMDSKVIEVLRSI